MNTSTDDLSFDCNLFFFLVEWCIVVFAFCCHEIPRRQKKMCQNLGLQTTIFLLLCVLQQHHWFTKRFK